jgi:hypothetical protein
VVVYHSFYWCNRHLHCLRKQILFWLQHTFLLADTWQQQIKKTVTATNWLDHTQFLFHVYWKIKIYRLHEQKHTRQCLYWAPAGARKIFSTCGTLNLYFTVPLYKDNIHVIMNPITDSEMHHDHLH